MINIASYQPWTKEKKQTLISSKGGYLAPRCNIDKPDASLNNLVNGDAISAIIQLPKRFRGWNNKNPRDCCGCDSYWYSGCCWYCGWCWYCGCCWCCLCWFSLHLFVCWCSCCFSLKGCVSQVFSNDNIFNMHDWMAVCSITIKGALGWDDMTHTTHSTTQTFNFWHEKNPSLLVTASIYPKHHKYGKQSLAHSKSYHSPHVCHFYVLFPISP